MKIAHYLFIFGGGGGSLPVYTKCVDKKKRNKKDKKKQATGLQGKRKYVRSRWQRTLTWRKFLALCWLF